MTAAIVVADVVNGKDLIVLTIQEKEVPNLPKGLFASVPEAAPVIDTCTYYPRERHSRIEPIEVGLTKSCWVSEQSGHPVVKVFNNIVSAKLMSRGLPKGAPGRLALPVSGDDPAAKAKVLDMVEQFGFDAVDAGSIDESCSSPSRCCGSIRP